jgi:hypothetical protein
MKSEGYSNMLKIAQILQICLIIAVFIYLCIPIVIPSIVLNSDNDMLNLITITLAVISIVVLLLCYFLPKLMAKSYKSNSEKSVIKIEGGLLSLLIFRSAMIESLAIYGLILGILGASLYIILPFYIVAIAGLVIIFPSKDKWNRMAAMFGSPAEEIQS